MLPYCKYAYITMVEADGGAEVFFDNLELLGNWTLEEESKPEDDNGYTIRFTKWANSAPEEI